MKLNIDEAIANRSSEEIVEAIYYAMRYIKQAWSTKRIDKDIFQDAHRSLPSPATQALTLDIVRQVERSVGVKAEHLDDKTFAAIFTFLSAAARSQRGEMSEDERREAEALAAELSADPNSLG
jgi:hypothetical protein